MSIVILFDERWFVNSGVKVTLNWILNGFLIESKYSYPTAVTVHLGMVAVTTAMYIRYYLVNSGHCRLIFCVLMCSFAIFKGLQMSHVCDLDL